MTPEKIKANLGMWVQEEAFHTIAGACGDMIRAYDKVVAERDAALRAVTAYRSELNGVLPEVSPRTAKFAYMDREHAAVIEAARKLGGE